MPRNGSNDDDDPLVRVMKRYNIPITRENYLDLAYMGEAPEQLGAEQEADLPPSLQKTPKAKDNGVDEALRMARKAEDKR